jgi:hypothetical protein
MPRIRTNTRVKSGAMPGQPLLPVDNPRRTPHVELPHKLCAECFGPRSAHNKRPFCNVCLGTMFGTPTGYDGFLRSERARRAAERRRRGC